MIEGWIGAVLTTLLARQNIVKFGAKGAPLAIFDVIFGLLVAAGVLLILLKILGVITDALL